MPAPDIEQLVLTLRAGKGAYVPIMELGIHPSIKSRFLQKPVVSLKDDVEFWYQAGYDYIKLQPVANFNIQTEIIDENDPASIPWAPEGKGVICNWEDFEKFPFPKKEDFNYRNFEQVPDFLPEGMGVIGQYGDIFTMTWELMGFEGFSFALFENPDLIKALTDKIGELVYGMFEVFVQHDCVASVWYSDDIAYTSGLLISPEDLRKYFFPWLAKIGNLAKDYNKPFIYHTDGRLWDVMEDIINCGVEVLHPIEPKAMDIVEVKKQYGDRLCLVGNLDVGDLLTRGTAKAIRKVVKYNIENVGYNGGYCVGSGNSIPDYVRFENYLTMLEAAREFGSYQ